jgi:hypothetical protein
MSDAQFTRAAQSTAQTAASAANPTPLVMQTGVVLGAFLATTLLAGFIGYKMGVKDGAASAADAQLSDVPVTEAA